MSDTEAKTRRLAIMEKLLDFTNHMLANQGNADALVEGVDKRQLLMDEYDLLTATEGYEHPLSHEDAAEVKRIAKIILEKDAIISNLLNKYHDETKREMADNTRQQKVLGYMNNAMSSSGSYMDFKK